MAHFEVDFAKLKKIGSGSIQTFAELNSLPRRYVNYVDGKKSFVKGSKGQAVAERLVILGVGDWVNDERVIV